MKKALVLGIGALLLYALFRDFNAVKALMLLGALVLAYVLSEVRPSYLMAARVPVILISLAASIGLTVYPKAATAYHMDQAIVVFSVYALAFFVAALPTKDKGLLKEAAGLSALLIAAALNLAHAGRPFMILPLAVALVLSLFVGGRFRLIPVVATISCGAFAFFLFRGAPPFGAAIAVSDVERYLLLGVAFAFFSLAFLTFLNRGGETKSLALVICLYISADILLTLGFRFSAPLLHQPLAALLFIAPAAAALLQTERGGR